MRALRGRMAPVRALRGRLVPVRALRGRQAPVRALRAAGSQSRIVPSLGDAATCSWGVGGRRHVTAWRYAGNSADLADSGLQGPHFETCCSGTLKGLS